MEELIVLLIMGLVWGVQALVSSVQEKKKERDQEQPYTPLSHKHPHRRPQPVNTPARTNRPAPTRDAVVARHPAQKKKLSPYDIQLQKRREEIRRLREQTYFGVPAKVHKVVEVEKPKPKPKRPVIAPSATRVPAMPKDPPIPLMPAGMETLCLRCDEVREQLHERETLRKLMLMREVLGPPLSLRKDDLLLSFPYER